MGTLRIPGGYALDMVKAAAVVRLWAVPVRRDFLTQGRPPTLVKTRTPGAGTLVW